RAGSKQLGKMKLGTFPAAPRQWRKDGRVSPARAWRCRGGAGWLLAASAGCGSRAEMARPARDPGIDGPRDTVSATPPATPGFLAIPIDSGAPFRRLVNQLGPERLTLFLKLNRVDLAHVR